MRWIFDYGLIKISDLYHSMAVRIGQTRQFRVSSLSLPCVRNNSSILALMA